MTTNLGVAPPDYATEVGRVRLLTSDVDATDIASGNGTYVWSSDGEITALIELKGSVEHAALHILRLVAMTPALQYKKWSSADLSVDGPAITRALRELINDIEKTLNRDAAELASEYVNVVNTGPAVSQPAFFPREPIRINGVETDPSLPLRIL